jgi:hypothetical protein
MAKLGQAIHLLIGLVRWASLLIFVVLGLAVAGSFVVGLIRGCAS